MEKRNEFEPAVSSRRTSVSSTSSRLSGIQELSTAAERTYLTLIGPNAWSLAETVVTKSAEVFNFEGLELGRSMTSSKSVTSRVSKGSKSSKRSSVSSSYSASGYLTDVPPLSCKVMVDAASCAEPDVPPKITEPPIEDAQVLKLCLHPVELFSENVPKVKTIDQWRALSMIFLLDERVEADGIDVVDDLTRRFEEIRGWIRSSTLASGSKSAPKLLMIVLQHKGGSFAPEERNGGSDKENQDNDKEQNSNAQSPAGYALDCRTGEQKSPAPPQIDDSSNNAMSPGKDIILHEKAQTSTATDVEEENSFLRRVRAALDSPESHRLHRWVDFDDADAFTSTIIGLSKELIDSRDDAEIAFRPSFLEGITCKQPEKEKCKCKCTCAMM